MFVTLLCWFGSESKLIPVGEDLFDQAQVDLSRVYQIINLYLNMEALILYF